MIEGNKKTLSDLSSIMRCSNNSRYEGVKNLEGNQSGVIEKENVWKTGKTIQSPPGGSQLHHTKNVKNRK